MTIPTLFPGNQNLLPFQGEVYFYPGFFTQEPANNYFQDLQEAVPWRQEPIKIFGKEVLQPRLTAWYGDEGSDYRYSGITMHAHPWTATLQMIKQAVEQMATVRFTGALLNYYRDGKDSMGWHRDNEKELGPNPVIASVSLDAARRFLLRHYTDKTLVKELLLTHGSLLLMRGETQHYWEHSIPKTAMPTGSRINITFRVL